MISDTVKIILDAEKNADDALNDAKNKADAIISDAKKRANEIIDIEAEKTQSDAATIIDDYRQKGEQAADEISADTKKQLENLNAQVARMKNDAISAAVDILIEN